MVEEKRREVIERLRAVLGGYQAKHGGKWDKARLLDVGVMRRNRKMYTSERGGWLCIKE
jgi:hypothetical protein